MSVSLSLLMPEIQTDSYTSEEHINMAKMIPSVISPEVKSTAERHIFEWFRDDPRTADWIVLHSLGISNHNRVIHGETDFFVLVPYMGLFALEVKGGRVCREGGVWSFTDKYENVGTKNRGPFDQAWEGVFSIVKDIKSKLDNAHRRLEDIFFGIGVMFPDVEYNTVGCDEEQWQVFDCNDGNNVYGFIHRLYDGFSKKWETLYGHEVPFERLPSTEDVQYIAALLRGDFDKAVAVSVQIKYAEEELIKLTNEQYRCIDQIDDNKRCLIEGGAGTGKTLLAVEEAKKATAQGLKVALLCYNRNLGDWLEKYFDDVPFRLRPQYIGTFHGLMVRLAKKAGIWLDFPSFEDDAEPFYGEELPCKAIEALRTLREEKYDKIIVDEAQDLITKNYLDVFDKMISGGLDRGRWTFLGDFSQQAIYNSLLSGNEMKELIEERTSFIRFKLTINCRNTKTICDEIRLVTDFKAPSEVWSKVEGIPVQYLTYKDSTEEKQKLLETIQFLMDSHISPKKISILSPLKREKSIVAEVDEYDIRDYKTYGNNKFSFSTIKAFKGLENTVIILVDIDSIDDKQLMYVALSRARTALYVIESEEARKEYVGIQMRRLSNG